MCGICGIVNFDGRPVQAPALRAMVDSLAHRGPDDYGVWLQRGPVHIGLGHTRLKIIDLSDAAKQPMASDDGLTVIVFNGEIYNYRALRQQLQSQGCRFRTASDTEVILRLYEAEGERCVEKLDGMFAFAIWDGRRQQLFIARDRVGKKPLFYRSTRGSFIFGSEAKAVLSAQDAPPEVNTEVLPAFFLYGYAPTPQTFYRGIQKLPPGHTLSVLADGSTRLSAYWDLPVAASGRELKAPESAAIERVRALTTDAVRKRLIADVPLGAFLSGGIDSSIIVGLMSRLTREPVRTFSIGFTGDARFNETSYARMVAAHFGTTHTEFVVEPSAIEWIDRLVWHHDGPFADSSAIPTYLLSRLTRQHVTVALNGDGGDEVFAGYLRFYAAVLCERVPKSVRSGMRWLAGLPQWGGHRSLFRRMQKFAGSAALPFEERFSRWISVFYEDLPDLFQDSKGAALIPQALTNLNGCLTRAAASSDLTKLLYLNLKTYLLDDLLVKMDRCSMAHGLETRSPFLDQALMEYVFSLPDSSKLRWGKTKVILRRAFADLLPEQVLRRGKMGFGVPLRAWFSTQLRGYLQDALLSPDARLRGYLNQGYVRKLYESHCSGYADHSHRLWTLLTFEVWLRQLSSRSLQLPEPSFERLTVSAAQP